MTLKGVTDMKDRKRKLVGYQAYDYEGIENFLEKMAKKGWKLENIGAVFWSFVKIEQAKLHYTVVYMPKVSGFDPDRSQVEEFSEYCKSAGWEHASGKGNLQIYCSADEHPLPIETDEKLKFATVKSSMLKTCILPCIAVLMLFYVGGMRPLGIWSDPIGVFGSYLGMFTSAIYFVTFAIVIASVVGFLAWVRRSKKSLASGGTCASTGSTRKVDIALFATMFTFFAGFLVSEFMEQKQSAFVCSIVFIVLLIVVIILERILIEKLRKTDVSKSKNMLISVGGTFVTVVALCMGFALISDMLTDEDTGAATRNAMTLTSHDLRDVGNEKYIYHLDKTSTIFMEKESGWMELSDEEAGFTGEDEDLEGQDDYEMDYDILYPKEDWLYDRCLKQWMKEDNGLEGLLTVAPDKTNGYQKVEGLHLQADAAYRYRWEGEMDDLILLCYPDKIVRVHCWFYTDDKDLEKIDEIVSGV